jgi:hypothetical protein
MKTISVTAAFVALVAFGTSEAFAIGVSAKFKAKKYQADLVPAMSCATTDSSIDCDTSIVVGQILPAPGGGNNVTRSAANGNDCIFESGTVKVILGKDTQVQLKGVACGAGTPKPFKETGALCAHMATYSTFADEEIDKSGTSTPESCQVVPVGEVAGTSTYAVTQVGNAIACGKKGACKGVITQVVPDPCPGVDKITEIRRFEVFDGEQSGELVAAGQTIKACCGPGQEAYPGINIGDDPAKCPNPQDILAVPGTVAHGVP